MKYDLSSLMVTVTEEHMPFWQFFVRLCGIVGGIFSTTGQDSFLQGVTYLDLGCSWHGKESPGSGYRMFLLCHFMIL